MSKLQFLAIWALAVLIASYVVYENLPFTYENYLPLTIIVGFLLFFTLILILIAKK